MYNAKEIKTVLEKMRELLQDPEKFYQNGDYIYAASADGRSTHPNDPSAVRFTILGALLHVTRIKALRDGVTYLLLPLMENQSFHLYNAIRTHGEILALIDRAIETINKGK